MKRPWSIAVIILSLSLSGCASAPSPQQWVYQVGVSEDQIKRDIYECDREVAVLRVSKVRCMEAKGYSWGTSLEEAKTKAYWADMQRQGQRAASIPKETPFERLTEARRLVTRELLTKIDLGECPRLLPCLLDYEAFVRRIAVNVDYTFTSADELLFRQVREIGKASDEGLITQDQAVNRLLALDVQIDETYRATQIERARRRP